MKKLMYIPLAFGLFCFSCASNKKDEEKYKYMYGKWKHDAHDELWIDKNYVFFGCPDFPMICNYYIKNDSIICYFKTPNQIISKEKLPKQLHSDTIIFGRHTNQNVEIIPTKNYRVRPGIPKIDTSANWEKQAILEIVNETYKEK